jgi:DNA (cytosine-5)-methyltransferase 1
MNFGSVCSGIEAASCAWHPLGWRAQFLSEIEPFPSAVLAHHYPTVPNLGDMTKFKEWPDATLDLLVGGTPCQSFSVAGLRKGLADPRGNLMLTYLAIAERYAPRWLVWENVPGVLSSNGGRDFGTLLGGLAELGYGFAYRVLDAQYVRVESHARAVPQRRRRVFVVGHLGDWRRAAAVLFERESLLGHSAPRREAGKGIASAVARSVALRGREGGGIAELGDEVGLTLRASGGGGDKAHVLVPDVARALTTSNQRIDAETETLLVAHPLRAQANPSHRADSDTYVPVSYAIQAGAVRENPASGPDGVGVQADIAYTLEARAEVQAVADTLTSHWHHSNGATAGNNGGVINAVTYPAAVRRLTPRECERLQGFPDSYTDVDFRGKRAADGNRYKALGNSMAVNVMRHIGERIAIVDAISAQRIAA